LLETVHMNVCLVLDGYRERERDRERERERERELFQSNSDFCLWGWISAKFTKESGYTRRVARSHYRDYCHRKET